MLLRNIFPSKKHPEDSNQAVALLAKIILVCGGAALIWSGYFLFQWSKIHRFAETTGRIEESALRFVKTGVRNASFDYTVNGIHYTSQNIAFGGRPLGALPPSGPVTVYYDTENPEIAVLYRRPVEMVIVALILGLAAPFIASFIWRNYV